ncbi:MAG: lytic transglycosylase [Rhodospirillaceae bacterium]|nr:lytic transglycosylase [Rhodospirillaceae bacterium]
MKNNNRRYLILGDFINYFRQKYYYWALIPALIANLVACQNMPHTKPMSVTAKETSSQKMVKPESTAKPEQNRLTSITRKVFLESSAYEPTDINENNLVNELRSRFSFKEEKNPSIDAEINWFLRNPEYLERVFSRSEKYLYYIVEMLEEREMPLDIAILPVIESAFDPFAYSHGQAAGLWQIIPGTARHLGIKQNWWFDGRRDVIESTRAAFDYLQYLNDLFDGDWLLSLAGYNAGEGNVAKAIKRAKSNNQPINFWNIRPYLPAETRAYVPRFLALKQVISQSNDYNIQLPEIVNAPYFEVVKTVGQIDMHLAAELADIPIDELYQLNSGVNRWASDPDGPHRIIVPTSSANKFKEALNSLDNQNQVSWSLHEVQTGETLGHLAITYQTTLSVIKDINNLNSDMIRTGQNLMIPHATRNLEDYPHTVDARRGRILNQSQSGKREVHIVSEGDSLWSISKKFDTTVAELAKWNAMALRDPLPVGREIVIWINDIEFIPNDNERIRRLTYTVKRGDSLSRISTRFKVNVTQLLEWNNLSSEKYLQPGQKLVMFIDVTNQTT